MVHHGSFNAESPTAVILYKSLIIRGIKYNTRIQRAATQHLEHSPRHLPRSSYSIGTHRYARCSCHFYKQRTTSATRGPSYVLKSKNSKLLGWGETSPATWWLLSWQHYKLSHFMISEVNECQSENSLMGVGCGVEPTLRLILLTVNHSDGYESCRSAG